MELSEYYFSPKVIGKGGYGLILKSFKRNKVQVINLDQDSENDSEYKEVIVKFNTVDNEVSYITSISEIVNMIKCTHTRVVKIDNIVIFDRLSSVFPDRKDITFIFDAITQDQNLSKHLDSVMIEMEKGEYDLDNKKLDDGSIMKVLVDVLLALEHIHKMGIGHLDIKPSNVLKIGNHYKLCDFGLSNLLGRGTCIPSYIVLDYLRPPELIAHFPDNNSNIKEGNDIILNVPKTIRLDKIDMWCFGLMWLEFIIQNLTGKSFDFNRYSRIEDKDYDYLFLINHLMMNHVTREDREFLYKINDKIERLVEKYVEKSNISYNIQNPLLRKLLSIQPDNRPSATECLNDPYFSEFSEYINQVRQENKIKVRYIYKTRNKFYLKMTFEPWRLGAFLLFHKVMYLLDKKIQSFPEEDKFLLQCTCDYLLYKYFMTLVEPSLFDLSYYKELSTKYFDDLDDFESNNKVKLFERTILVVTNWGIMDENFFNYMKDIKQIERFVKEFYKIKFSKMEINEFKRILKNRKVI